MEAGAEPVEPNCVVPGWRWGCWMGDNHGAVAVLCSCVLTRSISNDGRFSLSDTPDQHQSSTNRNPKG